jgi:glycosyltransferase involved in cell wall biosynthesis
MLLDARFPPDIRVENEAASLLASGHEVHILCRQDGTAGADIEGGLRGLALHSIRSPGSIARWRQRLRILALAGIFVDTEWSRAIRNLASRERGFDVIHVHDLPLVKTALSASKRIGARVVADLHENYPMAMPYYRRTRPSSFLQRWRYSQRRWERYERRVVPRCDAVIAVADEMADRLVKVGIGRDRITLVENYVNIDTFGAYPIDEGVRDGLEDRYVITYAGTFNRLRGLDLALRAMRIVVDAIPSAMMMLVGNGNTRGELEQLRDDLSLTDHVTFVGHVDLAEVPSYIAASDVCILPLIRSVQTDAGMAHKLFQYMLLAKPVVASDCDGTQRVVNDAGCGILFPSGDSVSMADALMRLMDREMREHLGHNGRRAALDRYNWASAGRRLTDLYDELGASPTQRSLTSA